MSIAVEQLRRRMSLGSVVVMGAGMSLQARYPDTLGLNGLLWDALDADTDVRADLAGRLNLPDAPAKALIGDDFTKWNEAWLSVAKSPVARERFQYGFAALDSPRANRPSVSHEALARLIHSGYVELVVSFNWDSALERAYERVYGVQLPVGVLQKPHGDVKQPDAPWVLPHEDGLVGPDLLRQLSDIVHEHPRTLIVVGYSESDKAVVDGLIAPLDERWRTCRVGPSVVGSDNVVGTADEVLDALAEPLAQREDSCAWKVVTFTGQRGIDAALEGHRLTPSDVAACPPLPEVSLVVEALLRTFAVVINGESGSGKSITAYQVAYQLQQQRYEVLRLRDRVRARSPREWIADLALFTGPKVLFVDDAQDLGVDIVRELAEAADVDTLVLVAGVDHIAGGVATFSVTGPTAVGTLERYALDHAAELLPKVRELDDSVGDGLGDVRFEDRVRQAARETTAWQFFYTLTGGWRRTAHSLHEVRGSDRADLLACALAIAQIAGVDSGVTVEDLVPYAISVGRDRAWVERNLASLRGRRIAVEEDHVWRTAHLRTAYAVLASMLHPPRWESPPSKTITVPPIASSAGAQEIVPAASLPRRNQAQRSPIPEEVVESDRRDTATLLKCAVNSPTTSLRGIAWLLGRDLSTESSWVVRRYGVRTPEIDKSLTKRALSTPPGADMGMAAQLLDQLHGSDAPEVTETIWENIELVIAWVEALTPPTGWAIGNLVNFLHNDNKKALADAIDSIDQTAVSALIAAGGWPHIYSSMKAVDRIAQAGSIEFHLSVGEALDEVALDQMLNDEPELHAAGELLSGLAHLNPDMGIRLFEKHAPQLARVFSSNPLDRFHDLFETFAFLLQGLGWSRPVSRAPATARRAIRVFLRAMDTGPLSAALAQPKDDIRWHNFNMFVRMFAEIDPRGWARVAGEVDFEILDRELSEQLPRPGENILILLDELARSRNDEVLEMLDRHAPEFGTVHPYLAHIHSQLSIRLIEKGLPLDLGLFDQQYQSAAALMHLLGAQNPDVTREIAEANIDAFREGVARNFQPSFTDLSKWVVAADQWAPGLLDEALAGLPKGVVSAWEKSLRNSRSKREISPLIVRAAATGDTPAAAEATALMKRFPSIGNAVPRLR